MLLKQVLSFTRFFASYWYKKDAKHGSVSSALKSPANKNLSY